MSEVHQEINPQMKAIYEEKLNLQRFLFVKSVGELDVECGKIFRLMFAFIVMADFIARGNYLLSI